jgi:hypothetical protein
MALSTTWCVSTALIVVLWFAVLSQIFAQTTSMDATTATSASCTPRQLGCACGVESACDNNLVCIDDVCESATDSSATATALGNVTTTFNNTGTAPPEKPGLLEHEMTLLSISMALAILLVVLYYVFYDRPASRSADYRPIDETATAAIVAAADSDDDV